MSSRRREYRRDRDSRADDLENVNAVTFRQAVLDNALVRRWESVALKFCSLPRTKKPSCSSKATPMEKLIESARSELYVVTDYGVCNLYVIPELWLPSDDYYLLLTFLEKGDISYCNSDYFLKNFTYEDMRERLNAILEHSTLRRLVVKSIQNLTYETRCRIKSYLLFNEEMENMLRVLIRDANDFDTCRTLSAMWGINREIVRGHWAFLRRCIDRPRGDLDIQEEDRPLLAVWRERIIASAYMRKHLWVRNLSGWLEYYIRRRRRRHRH